MHQLVAEFDRLIAARLAHPSVAAPIATGTDGIVVYLVQAFVPADSLDVVIRDRGAAPPAGALRVAAQLAGALDVAAAVGVHHGALHPRDVLLSQDDARLTALRVTRALQTMGVTAPVRRPYTAPERVEGGDWDRRADIFSLAALVHEMLWGRRIMGVGAEAAESLTALPGGDPAALRRVFARALAPDAADRFATALEFAAALNGAFPEVVMAPVVAAEATSAQAAVSATEDRRPRTDDRPAADPADDVELRSAGEERYEDADMALAIGPGVEPDIAPGGGANDAPMAVVPAALAHMPSARLDSSRADEVRTETTRGLLWPAAAAYLITGLGVGFGAGYLVFNRQPAVQTVRRTAPAAVTAPSAPPAVPESREYTEGAIKDAPVTPATEAPVRSPPSAFANSASADKSPPRGGGGTRNPDAAGDGRLLVRSTPANAQVFVDGRERGRTPATIRGLGRGTHRVRVVQDGYVAEERRVVITASRPAQSLTFSLERPRSSTAAVTRAPAPGTPATLGTTSGTLDIDSRPPGASVFLDGRLVGTTPFSSAQVGAGQHEIRLERAGYRRWSTSVRVESGERNRVRASMER